MITQLRGLLALRVAQVTDSFLEVPDVVVGIEQVEDGVENQVHKPITPARNGAAHIAEDDLDPATIRCRAWRAAVRA